MFSLIPVGATLTRSYYAVPTHYGPGTEHASFTDALEAAVARYDETGRTLDTRVEVTVDLRWLMTYPAGGTISSTDLVVERITKPVEQARALVAANRAREAGE